MCVSARSSIFIALLWNASANASQHSMNQQSSNNNWAVVVDTSRFWFNYRHIANALSLYHSVKLLGIPDSQIILMLADQMPCNARNCFPGQIFNSKEEKVNLYGENVEVDYRGLEVTVANFITILTGRHEPGTPISKRLQTDEHSNIFIFLAGHGGDGFLKFQDAEEISSQDIADAIQDMHVKKRYNEILFMVDTCQAGSLADRITSPNVLTIGSSKVGENSYAHHADYEVGVSVIDRFTYYTLEYLRQMKLRNTVQHASIEDLLRFYDPKLLLSHPTYRTDLLERSVGHIPITDFLGSVLNIELRYDEEAYPIEPMDITSDQSIKAKYQNWLPYTMSSGPTSDHKDPNCRWDLAHTDEESTFQFKLDAFLVIVLMFFIVCSAFLT